MLDRPILDENSFTKRELEVLDLMSFGLSYQEISDKLGIKRETTKQHADNIKRKYLVNRRYKAVAYAFMDGIIVPR